MAASALVAADAKFVLAEISEGELVEAVSRLVALETVLVGLTPRATP